MSAPGPVGSVTGVMTSAEAIAWVEAARGWAGGRAVQAVVRFNGGAQAAHNVVTADGRHHTFAQFGSGTFTPGVRTHLSRFMLVDPLALAAEAGHLAEAGGPERDLRHQERVTQMLLAARPVYEPPGPDWPGLAEDVLGAPVVLRSFGPTTAGKRAVAPAPPALR